jgi:lysyl-tRNA synthetase class 1
MQKKNYEGMHWSDQTARKIIEEKGDKEKYICASGITPSGVVHIGNFREMITVDIIARALKKLGKKVLFIYSWDDYDVFRKVPKGFPKQEELRKELRKPIVDIFDPYGEDENYARHNEHEIEKLLPLVGIQPEFLYQSKMYKSCKYKEGIKIALENTDKIKLILNKFRKEPLEKNWLPISIFDPDTKTDETSGIKYFGGYKVSYKDKNGKLKEFDFSKDGRAKLLWRIDWPMRWAYEKVDFEPGGKDHSSPGGSFDTAKDIVKLYGWTAPTYIMYDFIRIKGAGGKISSSSGNVISLKDVLEIYSPEVVRYLFAGARPGTEFAISFDLDAIKIYEDFDKLERIYFGKEEVNSREKENAKVTYELSCINKVPKKLPVQFGFRHLVDLIQLYNVDKVKDYYKLKNKEDIERLKIRVDCVKNWLEKYAPDHMKFKINDKVNLKLNDKQKKLVKIVKEKLENNKYTQDSLHNEFYNLIKENNSNTKEFFELFYNILISKEKGPKLSTLMLEIGVKKVIDLFNQIV